MNHNKKSHKEKSKQKTRLRISLRITALVLAIFIIASLVCLFSFQSALNNLAKNSKNKIVESVATMVSSSHYAVAQQIIYTQRLNIGATNFRQIEQRLRETLDQGKENQTQKYTNDLLKAMIKSGFLGLDAGYFSIPSSPDTNDKSVIVASNDNKYFSKQVPDEVAALIKGKENYRLFEDGIPAMGLKGPYLVTSYELAEETTGDVVLWYFDFKPMGKLLSGIDNFYSKENRKAVLMLCLAICISAIVLLIISFLVLGHLIKKRISKPIDELSQAAEMVMEGDMDVRLEIKKREEFSALKSAFNGMISGLSVIITKSAGQPIEEGLVDKPEREGGGTEIRLKPKSTILFQVIALFTAVFIGAGAFFMLSIGRSMDSLVKKSKNTLIETEGKLVLSGHQFGSELVSMLAESTGQPSYSGEQIKEFMAAVSSRTISSYQQYTNELLKTMVITRLFGYELVYCILPPGPLTDEYLVVFSSDDRYMYTKPPKKVLEFFNKSKDTYIYLKDGIPEMGLDEPYLATSYAVDLLSMGGKDPIIIEFRPMGKEVKDIDAFYNHKNDQLILIMGLVICISIFVLVFITILALAYLIRKQITGPIDELVVVADKVMGGDLDVQVRIQPGEELESLKMAFNEMIKALRDIVEKSAGH